jgi:hypothetical protein
MDYDKDFQNWCMNGNDPEQYIYLDLVSDDMYEQCCRNILMDCI